MDLSECKFHLSNDANIYDIICNKKPPFVLVEHIPTFNGKSEIEILNNTPILPNPRRYISTSNFDRSGYFAISRIKYGKYIRERPARQIIDGRTKSRNSSVSHLRSNLYSMCSVDSIFDRGHLVASCFDGLNSECNVVPMTKTANRQTLRRIETLITRNRNQCNVILYSVTPIFRSEEDIVPTGFVVEVKTSTKHGEIYGGASYVYNSENGFQINYLTGEYRCLNNGETYQNTEVDIVNNTAHWMSKDYYERHYKNINIVGNNT